MANIKDKIKKLLALSASPNENEAKAALLKAKELMMANKIEEADLNPEETEIVHMEVPDVKWTTDSGRVWIASVCKVICENHLCVSAWGHEAGHRTYTLEITGMKSDAQACAEIIKYAVNFMVDRAREIARKTRARDLKSVERSYASGFVKGLELLYDLQKDEHPEWGLVVQENKRVQEYQESLQSRTVRTRSSGFDVAAHMAGKADGLAFNPGGVLGQTN